MPTSASPFAVCSATWIGIALVQLDLHARKARREIAHDRRQHVARLRVRGRDGERAFVLVPELGADALDVLDLPQRAARGGDHGFAGRRDRREALAGANEDADPELVLELAHLLAHAGLRREQRCGGVRHVEAVVDDRAEIAQLLEVQGSYSAWVRIEIDRNYRAAPRSASANPSLAASIMAQFFQVHPANPQPRLIRQAAAILREGGVIAYPTDSSYALGCHIGDAAAAQAHPPDSRRRRRAPPDARAARPVGDRPFREARQLAVPDRPAGHAGTLHVPAAGDARSAAAAAAPEAQHRSACGCRITRSRRRCCRSWASRSCRRR